MEKLKGIAKSRKFWAGIVGSALIALKAFIPDFPLTEDQVSEVVYLLVAYIIGTGIEDSGLAARVSK